MLWWYLVGGILLAKILFAIWLYRKLPAFLERMIEGFIASREFLVGADEFSE